MQNNKNDISSYLQPVDSIEETETEWLIPYWVPKGGITLLVGDGGIGKTNLWCRILSDISKGISTFLDEPDDTAGIPGHAGTLHLSTGKITVSSANRTCIYFSKEDSTSKRLRRNFERYGANMSEILTVDIDHLSGFNYASEALEKIIDSHRPAVCVFDPVQAFYPNGASMSSRQQSREALDHLVRLAQKYNTAFILVCHTNKARTDDWRKKISGSADLPDIARSVIFTSYSEVLPHHTMRFISNEKNSYAPQQESVLYVIEDGGKIAYAGMSDKKFADFVSSEPYKDKAAHVPSQKELCAAAILELLADREEIPVSELDEILIASGFSVKTCATAKTELVSSGKIIRCRRPHNHMAFRLPTANESEA